ncbi:MAG: hypothetical protein COZ56_04525 [Armatimonadetes bacterium CG_4_8_14_3_um_filter_58_9]|nr:MAG: hypothetical protein COZ56_04525 [Armatimonadetes bacterium CG_4_8_14_3_um_filter_58_9]PJB71413.1 MAG: hypothetical protein CO095_08095 [Armatimonadetes bacterium CG_4_9_14_3_um_filter_58_7]
MVPSPVGQRCRECARGPKVAAYDVPWYLYLVAIPVALAAGSVAGWVGRSLSFLVFFIAPAIGGVVAQVVFVASGRKRGPVLAYIAVSGVVIGALCSPLPSDRAIISAGGFCFRTNAFGDLVTGGRGAT